jgi:ArsR family transcriptional regulator
MTSRSCVDNGLLIQRLQAIAEETRLAVLQLLSGGERCVCELQEELGAAQSLLSFHLKKLKDAGLIADRREGRWIYYRLVPEPFEEMRAVLGELEATTGPIRLGRDKSCCG